MGIELLTVDARIVVSSVDTYLRFAEATNRLDLLKGGPPSVVDYVEEGAGRAIEHVASAVVQDKVEHGLEKLEDGAGRLGRVGQAVVSAGERTAAKVADAVVKDDRDFRRLIGESVSPCAAAEHVSSTPATREGLERPHGHA